MGNATKHSYKPVVKSLMTNNRQTCASVLSDWRGPHIGRNFSVMYRVIHLWPLRYGNRYGHAKGEHVNRGRDTPHFCPTLQVHDIATLGDEADVKFGNFVKFQGTERFLIPCPRHVSSRLPLAVKPASRRRRLIYKTKFGEILYHLIFSFLLWLFLLLRSRLRKLRRDLWITL
jgi:hypothetical protein